MEYWVDIKSYEWLYQISNLWRVKSLKIWKEWILNFYKINSWHLRVSLSKNKYTSNYFIHRLMWQTFLWLDFNEIKKDFHWTCVRHKDNNPTNNNLNNLIL